MRALGEEAIAVFSERGDDAALVEAWLLVAEAELIDLRWGSVALAVERATEHADLAGGHPFVQQEYGHAARLYGPFPVEEALAWFDESPVRSTFASAMRGGLEAMRGNFERARLLCADAIEQSREQGRRLEAAGQRMGQAEIELVAGDAEAAAEASLLGVEELDELGERGWLPRVAGLAAEALYRLGREDEAWRLTERAEGAADDASTQMLIRQVRAKVLARRGELAEAERLAREAVALAEPTDWLEGKADTFYDLAIVLVAADKREQAVSTLETARRLYAEKGHTVGVARVDELRADLLATLET